jgi:hypothetical protein
VTDSTDADRRREVRRHLFAIETWCERVAQGRCTVTEALDAIDALTAAARPWAA